MTHSAINFEYIKSHKNTIDRIAGESPLAVKTPTPVEPLTETERKTERERIAQTPNHFADLMREYERAVIANRADLADRLTDLAYALTFSVLKKLHGVGSEVKPDKKTGRYNNPKGGAYSIVIESLIKGLQRDRADLGRIVYAVENATARQTRINRDGEEVIETVIVDHDCNTAAKRLAADTLSDGSDLVNTAIIALLDETEKARDRADLAEGFMEVPYNHRVLKTRVIIAADDPVKWETVETMPIRQAFRAVRRAVEATRAVQNASNKYTYIDNITVDSESGESETVYNRLPMYSNLAGEVTDISGKVVYIAADRETVDRAHDIVKSLDLSDRQSEVLRLRMSGYGYDRIANRLGIQKRLVVRTVKQIQVKMWDMGIHPDDITERPEAK